MQFASSVDLAAGLLKAADLDLGKPLRMKEPMAFGTLLVRPDSHARPKFTRDQAIERVRHETEEKRRKIDAASVNGLMTICQTQRTGAVMPN